MKKLFIALPFVAGAAAVAGTSHYAGSQTESEYHKLLTRINDQSPFVLVNEEYESGFTSSYAVTKVMASKKPDAEVVLRLQHDIQHAPVRMGDDGVSVASVSINTRLHGEQPESLDFSTLFAEENPFELNTDISYAGKMSNQLLISALEVSEDGKAFSWSGLNFSGVTKEGLTVGDGTMGFMSFSDENTSGVMSIADSQINLDVQHHGDHIYTGTGDFQFDNVSIQSPEFPVPVKVDSIVVNGSTQKQNLSLSGGTLFSFKGIESDLPINNASLDVQMEGMLIEGMRQYNSVMSTFNADPERLLDDSDFSADMINAFREMFAPGTAVTYALALDNSDGNVKADIRLAMKDASAEGMSADALKNVVTGRDLLNILTLDGTLNADTAALAQTPVMMMLDGAGEFITVTDESITSKVSLDGTTLTVNGVELPLDLMSGGMLDVPVSDFF